MKRTSTAVLIVLALILIPPIASQARAVTGSSASFAHSYGGQAGFVAGNVRQTSDGYIVSGFTASPQGELDPWLLKLDGTGAVLWQKSYNSSVKAGLATSEVFAGPPLVPTSDGGFIVASQTTISGQIPGVWVFKVNGQGTLVWQETLHGLGIASAYSLEATSDGGSVVAGTNYAQSGTSLLVVKLDGTGVLKWQKLYAGAGIAYPTSIRQTSDNGFILTGYRGAGVGGTATGFLLKLDVNGGVQWTKTFGQSLGTIAAEQTSDGGYTAAGTIVDANNKPTLAAFHLDKNGAVVWQKSYGGASSLATSIRVTSDGGFIVSTQEISSATVPTLSAGVLRLDSAGNIVWQRSFGTLTATLSEQVTTDGGSVFAGIAYPTAMGSVQSALVFKLDTGGNIGSCTDLSTTTLTASDTTYTVSSITVMATDATATAVTTTATATDTSATATDLCQATSHTYHPGVVVGNTASYKFPPVSWTSDTGSLPAPQDLKSINDTDHVDMKVTAVSATTATISLDWYYRNGTVTHPIATIDVAANTAQITGTVPLDLSRGLLAAGLAAPAHTSEAASSPTLTTTVTRNLLGADRTVNFLNTTLASSQITIHVGEAWDQASGIAVGTVLTENLNLGQQGTGHGRASIVLTATNIWSAQAKTKASLTVSCPATSIITGSSITCTVTVTGSYPTGDVTFTTSSTGGSFNHASCTLSYGQCALTYADTSPAGTTATITASYTGDTSNTGATNTFALNIVSGTLTLNNGQASLDQTSTTGVSVTITGSTAASGTPLTITTQTLNSPSTGVGIVSLSSAKYFDVKVTGINDGSAKVCITYGSIGSSTTMQYWSGSAWTTATGVTAIGNSVCGSIPVSLLAGTNIAVGNTVQQTQPSPGNNNVLLAIIGGIVVAVAVISGLAIFFVRKRKRSGPSPSP